MKIEGLTPILNVSNMIESFSWFEKLGWQKAWDWGEGEDGLTFGAVCNGHREIFLCLGAQGSRGGPLPKFVGDDETGGVWRSRIAGCSLTKPSTCEATWHGGHDAAHRRAVERA